MYSMFVSLSYVGSVRNRRLERWLRWSSEAVKNSAAYPLLPRCGRTSPRQAPRVAARRSQSGTPHTTVRLSRTTRIVCRLRHVCYCPNLSDRAADIADAQGYPSRTHGGKISSGGSTQRTDEMVEPSQPAAGMPDHTPYVDFRDVPPGPVPPDVNDAVRNEQSKGNKGLIIGALIILAGIVMIFGGITGSVDLVVKSGGTSLHITTAVVGVVVALIGLAVIIVTDPKVKVHFAKGK